MATESHTTNPSRRAVLLGTASAVALSGVPAIAATGGDKPLEHLDRIVADLRNVSEKLPMCTYWFLQAVANRIDRDVFNREPRPLPHCLTDRKFYGTDGHVYITTYRQLAGTP